MITNKKVTLIVTGSVAVYKSLHLVRLLKKANNDVRVVMTEAATKFVQPLAFETLSKNRVLDDSFEPENPSEVKHIDIADSSDVVIVAPATADILAKIANGIADNMASTILLATTAPTFIVPAMNSHMYDNPATQRNLQTIREDGDHILEPDTGFLAEGYSGKGRMPEPEKIVDWVSSEIEPNDQLLLGKKIIVSAGGTREPIDPVRYITNHSSGKMGFAVAKAAADAGAEVTIVAANTSLPTPAGVKIVPVSTAVELADEITSRFPNADGLVMAAAVADFRPKNVADHKIKKQADQDTMTIELEKNPDIVKQIAANKRSDQFVVGFAAETNDLVENAQKKIASKKLDLIVANDVSGKGVGFNSDNNQVTFIFADGHQQKTPVESKQTIANELVKIIGEF
ncbi:bifunctional phosphopantothenoylcysteine decarboxylase/phosphopantothenate--cysteine ligase CoaBC [Lentilactobacillus sp. Marseille-Q4993]|uniref:bifunctional phosphopantothenoylcysteine decarboxylase/phosphopantothenate--cysteine ligase CoaBC n=1 Tax=Lentilactobacillus sp. Marseille-Q4993 TaxID=3039492 RepID=UPI0024BD2BC7|nr:bifunctional phosphopantothenoylcysteine decarboxylase/phosphopantothenate--cysteine ligase CoaBC [Lentilactobacillus sp. Marseille-Q4993]